MRRTFPDGHFKSIPVFVSHKTGLVTDRVVLREGPVVLRHGSGGIEVRGAGVRIGGKETEALRQCKVGCGRLLTNDRVLASDASAWGSRRRGASG